VALSACVWALGRYLQNGLHALELLAVEAAALATLGALELLPYYLLTKPLVMVIAMIFVAGRAYSTWASGTFGTKSRALLLGALLFSLAGDVFLMLPGDYFIPGLASFLVAHLFYIALFRQGQAWFPRRGALLAVLAFGAAVYAVLWNHLGHPVLQGAVAAYVSVISLMAAQALGRATVNGDGASRWVAAGACIFMLSDALIAVNKFLTPVPLAGFWILLTYYCAQLLIVHHVVGPRSAPPAQA
jgi:alkylglycerol monooxygenase